jgi:hypothetical protein
MVELAIMTTYILQCSKSTSVNSVAEFYIRSAICWDVGLLQTNVSDERVTLIFKVKVISQARKSHCRENIKSYKFYIMLTEYITPILILVYVWQ